MTALFLAIAFTISVSALCSILEAMILSTTTSEIEGVKRARPKLGLLLERYWTELEETTSAILSLNTIANTLGATLVGGLAAQLFGEHRLIYFSIGLTLGILLFSEVIPKNMGVVYRSSLLPILIRPLQMVRLLMRPVSFLCKLAVYFVLPKRRNPDVSDDDIRYMAEKSEKDGNLTQDERAIITNALSLDDVLIEAILTPRTVVTAIEQSLSVTEVFEQILGQEIFEPDDIAIDMREFAKKQNLEKQLHRS